MVGLLESRVLIFRKCISRSKFIGVRGRVGEVGVMEGLYVCFSN